MSVYNCIEKPLHTSSFKSNIKNFIGICCATMLTTFALSLLSYGSVTFTVETFANSLITPVIILIVSVIFLILLRAMQNFNLSSLYQNFHLFNRYVDKASTTIPKYVDLVFLYLTNILKKELVKKQKNLKGQDKTQLNMKYILLNKQV